MTFYPQDKIELMRGRQRHQSAFTLTELLVVITIMVIVMALAVPAFNLLSGNRSVENAGNQISALLGRARAEAIGLQRPTGVMFYIDNATNQRMAALVQQSDINTKNSDPSGTNAITAWLKLTGTGDADTTNPQAVQRDTMVLPAGVDIQLLIDGSTSASADRYLGFNDPTGAGVRFGGVILFDGSGKLMHETYGFRCTDATTHFTPMGSMLHYGGGTSPDLYPKLATSGQPVTSAIGFAVFDRQNFLALSGGLNEAQRVSDVRVLNSPTSPLVTWANEQTEEQWLDQNATPYLINRYNGTLVKSQ